MPRKNGQRHFRPRPYQSVHGPGLPKGRKRPRSYHRSFNAPNVRQAATWLEGQRPSESAAS